MTALQIREISFHLKNLTDTERLGRCLGELAEPGDVLCLDGDLGAGKTTLTRAIAKGLDVQDAYVSSPSFSLFNEYGGRIPLYHFDFYRLSDAEEIEMLGLDEFFYLSGLAVIEWSMRAEEILPEESLKMFLQVTGEESRTVTVRYPVQRWHTRIQTLSSFIAERQCAAEKE